MLRSCFRCTDRPEGPWLCESGHHCCSQSCQLHFRSRCVASRSGGCCRSDAKSTLAKWTLWYIILCFCDVRSQIGHQPVHACHRIFGSRKADVSLAVQRYDEGLHRECDHLLELPWKYICLQRVPLRLLLRRTGSHRPLYYIRISFSASCCLR